MKLIDLHSDTFFELRNSLNRELKTNKNHIDLEKLKNADSYVQTFALFDFKEFNPFYDFNKYLEFVNFSFKIIEKEDLLIVKNYKDIIKKDDRQKILLSMEDMGSLKTKENIKLLYNKGFRMMSLIWNNENNIGYPNTDIKNSTTPLKPYGKEVVEYMNHLKIIIDVSHLNDGGFYDVANLSKQPFVASHSNARSLCNHKRNLTNDMIKTIANKGGIIGINFYSKFLNENSEMSMVKDIISHMSYIKKIGGIDVISFGSDYDGIDCPLELKDISHIPRLIPLLEKAGFSLDEIEKIYYKNALSFFRRFF